MPDLVPLGDRAWIAHFATEADARCWARAARAAKPRGVVDVVLSYKSASVHFEPEADIAAVESWLRGLLPDDQGVERGRLVTLPVLYDGEDLPDVAAATGLAVDEVVGLHAGTTYDVFAIGFQPGFPYAGYLPPPLDRLPRRPEPRVRVPSGSVAIASGQTGVYPAELPGGWNLLGRTPLSIVDVVAGRFPIRAGDRLRFELIGAAEFTARKGEPLR